jgi:WD40 repeat protein
LASGGADETIRLWNVQTGACLQTFRAADPYRGMNITGVTGITAAQRSTLKALGAVEDDREQVLDATQISFQGTYIPSR